MLIGLRMLLVIAVMAAAISFLTFLFTKNPKFLGYTKLIIKVTFAFVAFVAIIYVAERFLFG